MNLRRAFYSLFMAVALIGAGCAGCDDDPGQGTNGTPNNQTNNETNNQTNNQTNSQTNNQTNSQTNNECVPQADDEVCADAGAECGTTSAEDNCGDVRDVDCGGCADGETCADDNTCECTDPAEDICARLMKDCGMLDVTDECGVDRTVDCGTCMDGELCGESNVCGCPCTIDGECVPDGMLNPDNSCEVCDPMTTTDDWTPLAEGSACDDGLACTSGETCDDRARCEGGDIAADSCQIDGTCYSDGDDDPSTSCRVCDPGSDAEGWTELADDTPCDDDLACTSGETCNGGECVSDTITAGTCAIDSACYNQGDLDPNNPCQVCNPQDQQDDWSDVSENTACDDGLACTSNTACDGGGECVGDIMDGTCAVDGVCYNDGEANPNNECETCDVTNQQDDWSGVDVGTVCDDGFVCTENDACDGGGDCVGTIVADACLINDQCYADGEFHPNRECIHCDPASDQEDWTFLPVGTICDDGLNCTADDGTCNPGGNCRAGTPMDGTCAIDDACYMDGDVNPGNPCESCQAAIENTDWSPLTGDACDDGLACTSNDMCDANGQCVGDVDDGFCAIDDGCHADGSLHPDNECEFCDVAEDQTDWSPTPVTTVCDDGLACSAASFCDGGGTCETDTDTITDGFCAIDEACFADGDTNPDNSCEICRSADDQTGWSSNDGITCENGDMLSCTGVCDSGQCVDDLHANSCLIDNACYADGDTNPMNQCEICSPSDDTQDWTVADDETTCAGGNNLCCAGMCLAVAACP